MRITTKTIAIRKYVPSLIPVFGGGVAEGGIETMLVVVFWLVFITVVGVVVVRVELGNVVEALGNAAETTVPFGYWHPQSTKPLGQDPILWQTAPGGQVTCEQLIQEVRFAAYASEVKNSKPKNIPNTCPLMQSKI